MNFTISLFVRAGVALIFGLLVALLIMPHFSKTHAGDGHGMRFAAVIVGLVVIIVMVVMHNR